MARSAHGSAATIPRRPADAYHYFRWRWLAERNEAAPGPEGAPASGLAMRVHRRSAGRRHRRRRAAGRPTSELAGGERRRTDRRGGLATPEPGTRRGTD